ncbi:MAG: aminopeptidase [Candidatus Baldrarchaeia archaeon]
MASPVRKLADLIAGYSVEVRKSDDVVIRATMAAMPLLVELYRAIVERGGYPIPMLTDELLIETFYRYADDEVLKHVSPIEKFIQEKANVMIRILSDTHTKFMSSIDPEKVKIANAARIELTKIFLERSAKKELRWTVAPYPTKALAQEAGMSFFEYEEFVYRACAVHLDDPISFWKKKGEEQKKIIELLSKVSELRFVAEDTDLTVRVDGRVWVNDDGHENMPGGEVFTAPIEDSVEGRIRFTYPAIWRGVEVEDVMLVFRKGEVVEARARRGEEFLRRILETDEGAKRVGELAFGLNYYIDKFTKNILFDEKIGGTIHMALGAAYPETGGKNVSAIHWDMIKDMKRGKVFADGDLIYENGKFVVEL